MTNFDDIFEAFGGNSALARAIGVKISTAGEMRRRGTVPPEHWLKLMRAAEERGIVGISAEILVEMYDRAKNPRSSRERQEPADAAV